MFQYAFLRGIASKNHFLVEIPADQKVNLWTFPIISTKLQNKDRYKHTYCERRFYFCPEVFDQPDDTDFVGYFQSEKYFKHVETEIRDTFAPSQAAQVETATLRKLTERGPVVSVHVRRRDYVNNDAFADLYGNYYPNAMSLFSDCVFLVVSDDIQWCRQRLKGKNVEFFNGSSVYADLAAMSASDHHIISNSTFGWWGAWLNASLHKRVVRPDQWWGPRQAHLEDTDICPESWEIAAI